MPTRRADPTDARYLAALRRGRLRVTPQRVAVLRALERGPHVASCHDIWTRARRDAVGLGPVTVYRILERLEAAGVVERLDVNGSAHFGAAVPHHDHAICERCGRVSATDTCLLEALADLRVGPHGFLVTRHRVDLIGLCESCQAADATSRTDENERVPVGGSVRRARHRVMRP